MKKKITKPSFKSFNKCSKKLYCKLVYVLVQTILPINNSDSGVYVFRISYEKQSIFFYNHFSNYFSIIISILIFFFFFITIYPALNSINAELLTQLQMLFVRLGSLVPTGPSNADEQV